MAINTDLKNKLETYKTRKSLNDDQLYVSIADTNSNFQLDADPFYLFSYYDPEGLTPDQVLKDFRNEYPSIEQRIKDDGGGYIFVVAKNKF